MFISDPSLTFDLKKIGEKVAFNQYKYDSLDGFIKNNDECLIILPSVHKVILLVVFLLIQDLLKLVQK